MPHCETQSEPVNEALRKAGVHPLMDTPTTAGYLNVPPATLDQWAYRGTGPKWSKVGRHRRYRLADVDAWLLEQRGGGDRA
jgi:hypothetical protein